MHPTNLHLSSTNLLDSFSIAMDRCELFLDVFVGDVFYVGNLSRKGRRNQP